MSEIKNKESLDGDVGDNYKSRPSYKSLLKYCGSSIRSSFEVEKKIKLLKLEEERDEILSYLESYRLLLSDEKFLENYLENLSSVKGCSYHSLYRKLITKVKSPKLLTSKLKEYFSKNEIVEIEKMVRRNKKKLREMTNEKRLFFIVSKGFTSNRVREVLNRFEF
jgi:SOS response regulatory protein OraA/RecX